MIWKTLLYWEKLVYNQSRYTLHGLVNVVYILFMLCENLNDITNRNKGANFLKFSYGTNGANNLNENTQQESL